MIHARVLHANPVLPCIGCHVWRTSCSQPFPAEQQPAYQTTTPSQQDVTLPTATVQQVTSIKVCYFRDSETSVLCFMSVHAASHASSPMLPFSGQLCHGSVHCIVYCRVWKAESPLLWLWMTPAACGATTRKTWWQSSATSTFPPAASLAPKARPFWNSDGTRRRNLACS